MCGGNVPEERLGNVRKAQKCSGECPGEMTGEELSGGTCTLYL